VQVDYTTVAGTATEPGDYMPVSGTLTFTSETPTLQQITVNVIGDTVFEPNETFTVVLSNLRGSAAFNDSEALGTIFNEDAGGPVPTPTITPTPTVMPTPSPAPFRPEGDVVDAAGSPEGDRLVLANDVAAARSFVLGINSPSTPTQFQVTDVNFVGGAPCGNGLLDAGDVAVIRQMVLGVIPNNSPLCGPTGPAAALTLVSATADSGAPAGSDLSQNTLQVAKGGWAC
jgi:hypothetical protein